MITNIKYELYQAEVESSLASMVFMSYDFLVKNKMEHLIVVDNYKKVIDGLLGAADSVVEVLDNLFSAFNSDFPRNFRSMSVSDVVVISFTENNIVYTKAYYCDSLGWVGLDVNEFLNLD